MNGSVLKSALLLAASLAAIAARAETPGEIKGTVDGREMAVAGTCDAIPEDQVFSFSTDGGEADVDGDGIAIEVGRWGAHWSLFVQLDGETAFHGMLPFEQTENGARFRGNRRSADGRKVDLELVITCE
jgi:hypothetical protein